MENEKRVLPVIYVLQTTDSMSGRPITDINHIVQDTLEALNRQSLSMDVDVRISCLTFGDRIEWAFYNAAASNLQMKFSATGVANLGPALQELDRKLTRTGSDSILPGQCCLPIIIFVSDGLFADDFELSLQAIMKNKWYEKATKICFIVGDDYEIKNLEKLTGARETILRRVDTALFNRLIQYCSVSCSTVSFARTPDAQSDADPISANTAMFDTGEFVEIEPSSVDEWDNGDTWNDGGQDNGGQDEEPNSDACKSKIHETGHVRRCMVCGHVVSDEAVFCTNCGKRLSTGEHLMGQVHQCMVCGHVVSGEAVYCPYCGSKLSIDKTAVDLDIKKVEFSAIVPKQLINGDYSIINVVIYEKTSRYIVDSIIKEREEPVQERRSGIHSVKEGSLIRIVLTSADIEIDDNEETGVWKGDHLIFSFAVMLPEQFMKRQILFTASVFINDVIACKLKFIAKCSSPIDQRIAVSREDIFSAFVSYASQDRKRVAAIVQGIQKARPDMDVFFDVESLRSGEDWEMALRREIERRDILYLCWSHFARDSKWVDAEWRFALERKGAEYIEPIPIESPENCPPPEELSHKHFNDKLLYIMNTVNCTHL